MLVAGDGWNRNRQRDCPEIRPTTEPCRLFRLVNVNATGNVAQYGAGGWFVSHPESVLVGCDALDPEGWMDVLSASKSDRLSKEYCLRLRNNTVLVTVADHTFESRDRSHVVCRTRMENTGTTSQAVSMH